ncbi:MAG TPA: SIMPL domain-containing protein [Polyangiaceae bacterium]|nr:SIMPL domain-containing protein [Polyangiaceae bacterium]
MRTLGLALVTRGLALSVGLFGVAGCTPQTVVNTSAPAANAPARGISVNGVGKANGKPNVARSTIGVEARAGTAEEAMAEVNQRMAQVIAAVKQAGVAAADVRTSTLSLNFERNYESPRPEFAPAATPVATPPGAPAAAAAGKSKSAGVAVPKAEAAPTAPLVKLPQGFYTATNSVEVTIRNLDAAGKVLSAATGAGANQLYGVRFEIEDPSALQADARKKAVEDARARAEKLAQLAGVKLGPAVSITELDGGGGPVPMFAMAKMDSSTPVERGELTVTSTVQIVFALPE